MSGSLNDAMKEFIEEWESVTPITNFIIKLDARGEFKHDGIIGVRKFKISTYERLLTQDEIKERELDPFVNGSFRPLIVPEDVTIESNPNALSDEDIDRIFGASELAWGEYLKVVNSPATLRRMVDRAEKADISLKRYRQLEDLLQSSDPSIVKRIEQKDQDMFDNLDKPSAARRGRPPKAGA